MKKLLIATAILLAIWGLLIWMANPLDPHPERYVE